MKEKQLIREEVWRKLTELGLSYSISNSIPPFKGQEQAAERLRGLEVYAKARRVFAPPDSAQLEVRANILRDGKTLVAEARTEETRQLIRDIKHITCRKYTAEEKIRIVLEGLRRDTPIRDLCRREGLHPSTYYARLKQLEGRHTLARRAAYEEIVINKTWFC